MWNPKNCVLRVEPNITLLIVHVVSLPEVNITFFQRIFPNSIFVKSMEPPLEREGGKAAKVLLLMKKPEKNSFEQRLQLTRTVFQLFSFFKKQVPVCIKTKVC